MCVAEKVTMHALHAYHNMSRWQKHLDQPHLRRIVKIVRIELITSDVDMNTVSKSCYAYVALLDPSSPQINTFLQHSSSRTYQLTAWPP
jgi:hypothetical protein